MISIVQNFICNKAERLEVIKKEILKNSETHFQRQISLLTLTQKNNFESVKSYYLDNIPKMNLYNDLTKDWALVTALAKEVKTPYLMYICEDMEVNCSNDEMNGFLNEFYENDFDYCFK